ncbi:hypothetical protein LSAT2_010475 [Lamellibrachia satsuma]|nr:hypothetical protein LSAT2_010475 [Lamellibrachia satsuma]
MKLLILTLASLVFSTGEAFLFGDHDVNCADQCLTQWTECIKAKKNLDTTSKRSVGTICIGIHIIEKTNNGRGIDVETKRWVVHLLNKGNKERTKRATLGCLIRHQTRFFKILCLPRDFLFNVELENWVHREGYTRELGTPRGLHERTRYTARATRENWVHREGYSRELGAPRGLHERTGYTARATRENWVHREGYTRELGTPRGLHERTGYTARATRENWVHREGYTRELGTPRGLHERTGYTARATRENWVHREGYTRGETSSTMMRIVNDAAERGALTEE